jgi:hypothetical protein
MKGQTINQLKRTILAQSADEILVCVEQAICHIGA